MDVKPILTVGSMFSIAAWFIVAAAVWIAWLSGTGRTILVFDHYGEMHIEVVVFTALFFYSVASSAFGFYDAFKRPTSGEPSQARTASTDR